MSDRTEIDAIMVMAEKKEMDQKRNELGEGGFTDQMSDKMIVTMTDKGPAWSTPCIHEPSGWGN